MHEWVFTSHCFIWMHLHIHALVSRLVQLISVGKMCPWFPQGIITRKPKLNVTTCLLRVLWITLRRACATYVNMLLKNLMNAHKNVIWEKLWMNCVKHSSLWTNKQMTKSTRNWSIKHNTITNVAIEPRVLTIEVAQHNATDQWIIAQHPIALPLDNQTTQNLKIYTV